MECKQESTTAAFKVDIDTPKDDITECKSYMKQIDTDLNRLRIISQDIKQNYCPINDIHIVSNNTTQRNKMENEMNNINAIINEIESRYNSGMITNKQAKLMLLSLKDDINDTKTIKHFNFI